LSVSSTTANIAVFNSSTDGYILITQSGAAQTLLGAISTTGFVGTATNHDFVFRTNNTERMRIDSSGNLMVGVTSISAAGGTTFDRSGNSNFIRIVQNSTVDGATHQSFQTNGTQNGYIATSGGITIFSTTSDYRAKENVARMTSALDKVALLNPVTFNWIDSKKSCQGFIAHELQAVVPECVFGEKDATKEEEYEISPAIPAVVDEEGNVVTEEVPAVIGTRTVPVYQGIDTSFLVATLTAAIQEQQAMIDELKAKVAALEAA
jgi:hypothetical protein